MNLTATAISDTRIDLTWIASRDDVRVAGYYVYRNSVQIGTTTMTHFSDTGLTASTQYTYTVAAFDAAGNDSIVSDPARTTTDAPDTTAPSVPTGLTVTATGTDWIELAWTTSTDNAGGSGLAGYHVYRDATLIGTATGTIYSDSGLTPVTHYIYTVAAYDNSGNVSTQSGSVSVATDAGGTVGWDVETVYPGIEVGIPDLAVDGNGKVHISFLDFTNDAIRYASNASGSWVLQTVDPVGRIGSYTSLAVDGNGRVHISHVDMVSNNLDYATNASGLWVLQTVDSAGGVISRTSLALDGNGKAHISYRDFTINELKYATNASGSWVSQTVDSSGIPCDGSLALDGSGKAHISYADGASNDLKYASNASGSWVLQTVDSADFMGWATSLALDGGVKAHISYYDATNEDLKYATNASGSWVCQTVDSGGDVGRTSSLVLDHSGKSHIGYLDWISSALKYAKQR